MKLPALTTKNVLTAVLLVVVTLVTGTAVLSPETLTQTLDTLRGTGPVTTETVAPTTSTQSF